MKKMCSILASLLIVVGASTMSTASLLWFLYQPKVPKSFTK